MPALTYLDGLGLTTGLNNIGAPGKHLMSSTSPCRRAQQSCLYLCFQHRGCIRSHFVKTLVPVKAHWKRTDGQTCLSVWINAVFVSEPPQAASTDLYPDLYSLITSSKSLSLSLSPSPSLLCFSSTPVCAFGRTWAVYTVFCVLNTRNAIFLFAEINLKRLNCSGVVRCVNDPFHLQMEGTQSSSVNH